MGSMPTLAHTTPMSIIKLAFWDQSSNELFTWRLTEVIDRDEAKRIWRKRHAPSRWRHSWLQQWAMLRLHRLLLTVRRPHAGLSLNAVITHTHTISCCCCCCCCRRINSDDTCTSKIVTGWIYQEHDLIISFDRVYCLRCDFIFYFNILWPFVLFLHRMHYVPLWQC